MSCDCNCKYDDALDDFVEDGLYHKFDVFSARTGDEIEGFTFTLIPSLDPHAQVALLAYADSVADERPQLYLDIKEYLRDGASY